MEEKIYRFTTEDIKQSRKLIREIFAEVIGARSLGKTAFDFTSKQTRRHTDKTKVSTKVRQHYPLHHLISFTISSIVPRHDYLFPFPLLAFYGMDQLTICAVWQNCNTALFGVKIKGKKLPTLSREWVTSSYLAKKLASCIATLATWVRNSAQNCQSLVASPDFLCLETLDFVGTLPYHSSSPDWRVGKRLTYSLPFVLFYHMGCQSTKRRTTNRAKGSTAQQLTPTTAGDRILMGKSQLACYFQLLREKYFHSICTIQPNL